MEKGGTEGRGSGRRHLTADGRIFRGHLRAMGRGGTWEHGSSGLPWAGQQEDKARNARVSAFGPNV